MTVSIGGFDGSQNILHALRSRALITSNADDRATLQELADRIAHAIRELAVDETWTNLRELNGLWALADRALNTKKNTDPNGGSKLPVPIKTDSEFGRMVEHG